MIRTIIVLLAFAATLIAELPYGQDIRQGSVTMMLARQSPAVLAQMGIPTVANAPERLQVMLKTDDARTVAFRIEVTYIGDDASIANVVSWADAIRADDGTPRFNMAAVAMPQSFRVVGVSVRELTGGTEQLFAAKGPSRIAIPWAANVNRNVPIATRPEHVCVEVIHTSKYPAITLSSELPIIPK